MRHNTAHFRSRTFYALLLRPRHTFFCLHRSSCEYIVSSQRSNEILISFANTIFYALLYFMRQHQYDNGCLLNGCAGCDMSHKYVKCGCATTGMSKLNSLQNIYFISRVRSFYFLLYFPRCNQRFTHGSVRY